MVLRHVSTHDVARAQSEAFYHAFVLGLLVTLAKTHIVESNRDTGLGRADVTITPRQPATAKSERDRAGVVLEFKRYDPHPGSGPRHAAAARRGLKRAAEAALAQVQGQKYTTALHAAGANPIHRFGIAFCGKEVIVRTQLSP